MATEEKKFPYSLDGDALYQTYREQYAPGDRPAYAGTWDKPMEELYGRLTSRPAFSYDAGKDPLYQQYRDRYVQQGKLAMKDTMGQAAALTGGYGSTYGQSVGQQSYDAYLQKLGDVVPELYGKAYGRYQDEGDELMKQYALMGQRRDAEYGLYRDALGDWENERAYQTQRETEDYNRRMAEDERAYQRGQDELNQRQKAYSALYALIAASGYRPTDDELTAAGMTRAAADALADEYRRGVDMENQQLAMQQASRAASSGGGGGGRSSGGGRSYTGSARSESSPDTKISAPGKSYTNSNAGKSASAWNPKAAVVQTVAQKAAPVRAATSAALGLADKLKKKR